MQIGAVLPHNEIGTDPGAIRSYLQGVEDLGMTHLLIYDHVMGADPDRPGGFRGPYDKDVAFHEPLTRSARRMLRFYGPVDFVRLCGRFAAAKLRRSSIERLFSTDTF